MPALSLPRRATLLRPPAAGGGAGFTRVTGGVFNPIALNKTTGVGGDYPTGVVGLAAGVWTFNPFSGLTGYTRAFDATKPNNNWLQFVEADGPGTVTFDMRPDATGAFSNPGGGGFWVTGAGGSVRWCFNGAFAFNNGSVRFDSSPAVDRIIWFNTSHTFPSSEFSRQFTAAPSNLKGNDDPAAFRFHRNATRMYILRTLINDVCDDGVFSGSGGSLVKVIGAGISRVNNHGVGSFHNDGFQVTGGDNYYLLDSTLLTASFQLVAEAGQGNITNMVVDRCTQGLSNGATLGALGLNGGTMGGTNQIGQGAPTTRVSGHYIHAFANGVTDHGDGAAAQRCITSGPITPHVSIIDYGGTGAVVNSGACTVAVPTGVGGGLDSDGLPTNLETSINAALASADSAHQIFRAAYSASDLAAVMSDYGISFD